MGKIIRALRWLGKHKIDTSDMFPSMVLLVSFFLVISVMFALSGQQASLTFENSSKRYRISFEGGDLEVYLLKPQTADIEDINERLLKQNRRLQAKLENHKDESKNLLEKREEQSKEISELEGRIEALTKAYERKSLKVRIFREDLNGDGIKEIILWETDPRPPWQEIHAMRLTDIRILASESEDKELKEAFHIQLKSWLKDPLFMDLDGDGKKEIVITSVHGNGGGGNTFIIYCEKGKYRKFDSEVLGYYPLRISKDKLSGKTLLSTNHWISGNMCQASRLFVPSLYKWNGNGVVEASSAEKRDYYEKNNIPKLEKEIKGLEEYIKSSKDDCSQSIDRLKYCKKTLKIIRVIMSGRISDEQKYISNDNEKCIEREKAERKKKQESEGSLW